MNGVFDNSEIRLNKLKEENRELKEEIKQFKKELNELREENEELKKELDSIRTYCFFPADQHWR